MSIIIRKEFLESIQNVKEVVSKTSFKEQSNLLHFFNNFVIGFDGETIIASRINFPCDWEFSLPVELIGFLSSVPSKEISFEFKENHLILKDKRRRAKFIISKTKINFDKILPELNELEGEFIPENFLENLKEIQEYTSKDLTIPALNNILCRGKEIIACDRFKAMIVSIKESFKKEFQIPVESSKKINKFEDLTSYLIDENWLYFFNENVFFITRKYEQDYPNIKELFNKTKIIGNIKFPRTIVDILKRAKIFLNEDSYMDEEVCLSIKNKKIIIKSNSKIGAIDETVICKNEIEVDLFFNPNHFLEILQKEDLSCILCEDDYSKKLVFEIENKKYSMVLNRIEE